MDALIHFVCVAEQHAHPMTGARGDLTVHEHSWAFCPAEAREAHEWHRVSGVTVAGLRSFGLREPELAQGQT